MELLKVDPGPPITGYASPMAAIEATKLHPVQPQAREFTGRLANTEVVELAWAQAECEVVFSNGRLLRVQARDFDLLWSLHARDSQMHAGVTAPVELLWRADLREVFDPSEIAETLVGGRFQRLFVNDYGLYLYTESNPILVFTALKVGQRSRDFVRGFLEES